MDGDMPTQSRNYATLILGGLLVVAAFFIGTLWTKVQTLEKAGTVAGQQAAQPGQFVAQPAAAGTVPTETVGEVAPISDNDHVRGNKNAQITLIEYSDFECPFCKRFQPTIQQVMKEYGDKVAVVYRHFPLSFHPQAQPLAEASECVAEQLGEEGFWQFHDEVFALDAVDTTTLGAVSSKVGADSAKIEECVKSGKYKQKVTGQMTSGQTAGVTGTPGTIVLTADGDKEMISGALPFEQVKVVIDKYL